MKPQKRVTQLHAVPDEAHEEEPARALAHNPLGTEEILERFYRPVEAAPSSAKKDKPTHYKIVCISLYNEDIAQLEALVSELKRRGHTKANKSQIIRAALDQLDLDKVPKSY
jgi:hypothetical protein